MTGTFDNWSKSEKLEKVDGIFQKTVTLPNAQDKIYYKVRTFQIPLLFIEPYLGAWRSAASRRMPSPASHRWPRGATRAAATAKPPTLVPPDLSRWWRKLGES